MNWNNIIGHEKIIFILKNMLSSQKAPHALLFSGMSGIGKTLTAKIFAGGILCGAAESRPCGICDSCKLVQKNHHPDIITICPEGLAIKIDQIRALKRFMTLSPALNKGRVCVIEEAQSMTVQASNSILKILEEPPSNFYFILIANSSQPMIPTIVSRCAKINFLPLSISVLFEELLKKEALNKEKAFAAACLSGGRMGYALELLKPDGFKTRDTALEYFKFLSNDNPDITSDFFYALGALAKKEMLLFLEHVSVLIRDVLFLLVNTKNKSGAFENESLKISLFNPDLLKCLDSLKTFWNEEALLAAYDDVRGASRAVAGNSNIRLTLDALTIRLGNAVARPNAHNPGF